MTFSDKGSYRTEHVVAFIKRWCEEWALERAAGDDWRLLYVEALLPHMSSEVLDAALTRG